MIRKFVMVYKVVLLFVSGSNQKLHAYWEAASALRYIECQKSHKSAVFVIRI